MRAKECALRATVAMRVPSLQRQCDDVAASKVHSAFATRLLGPPRNDGSAPGANRRGNNSRAAEDGDFGLCPCEHRPRSRHSRPRHQNATPRSGENHPRRPRHRRRVAGALASLRHRTLCPHGPCGAQQPHVVLFRSHCDQLKALQPQHHPLPPRSPRSPTQRRRPSPHRCRQQPPFSRASLHVRGPCRYRPARRGRSELSVSYHRRPRGGPIRSV